MQKTQILNALIAGAFITASLGVMSPAYAINAQTDTVSAIIDTRDLETDYGIVKVYKSLEHRAELACESPGLRSLAERNSEKSCTQSLLDDFIVNVGHDGLTAYYEARQIQAS